MQQEIKKLHEMYTDALRTPKHIPDLMTYVRSNIVPLIPYYKSLTLDELKLNEELQMETRTIISALRLVYSYTGLDTGVEDSDYDILCENLDLVSDMEEEFTEPVTTLRPKGYHLYKSLRGTLDKVYFLSDEEKEKVHTQRKSLDDWIRTSEHAIQEATGKEVNLKEEPIYVFPKWDGVSVILEYDEHGKLQRALTRGYTKLNEAILVTDTFRELRGYTTPPFAENGPFGVKLEVMTTLDDLLRYNLEHPENKYKNTRSFASAIINQDDGLNADPSQYLKCVPLRDARISEDTEIQVLDVSAFKTPFLYCKLGEIDRIEAFCENHRFVNGLRCDGAVIYLINPEYQTILGRSHDKQKFEVAYKFTEEYKYATVRGVEFMVGLYGSITPVLKVESLEMKGNHISRISLGSIGRLLSMRIGKGDVVKVGYDIIPVCTFDENDPQCKRNAKVPFPIPTTCPMCGESLEIATITAKCVNPKCPTRVMGRIKSHIQRMRIQYIGDSAIEQFYYSGIVKHIEDLYQLKKKKDEVLKLENMGKKKFKRMVQEIEEVEQRTWSESQIFSSLAVERLSSGTFDKIFNKMDMDELMDIVERGETKKLLAISGIGPSLVKQILIGLKDEETKRTMKYLLKHLNVEHLNKENPFFTVVFSSFGVGDPRKERAREVVREQKGEVVEHINRNVDYLIVPTHEVQSRKVEYAKIHQIPIMTVEEFVQRTIPLQ